MSTHSSQDFLRGDARGQTRTLVRAGIAALAVIVVALVALAVIYPRATAPKGTDLHLVLPSLGPGVENGSRILLRGAEIGQVTAIDATEPDVVHIDLVLDQQAADSLTDAFEVDFRPQNYFGVTAINLIAKSGGSQLEDGQTVERSAAPDFTMSTMIERSSIVVDGTLTRDMIDSLDEVMRYADGLAPFIETAIILTDRVARTQRHLPSTLLGEMNDVAEVFPAFIVEAMKALDTMTAGVLHQMPDGSRGIDPAFHELMNKSLVVTSDQFFGALGNLLGSHSTDLTPLVTSLEYLADPVPQMVGGGASMAKTRKVIEQLRNSFGGSDQNKSLRLKLLLDTIPAVAGALERMDAAPGGPGEGN
ncbi:MlaD family protein [Gordonia terrae]